MNVIGIDATNIRAGGGLVHLLELLKHANPERDGFSSVVIWANKETLYSIDEQSWIVKNNVSLLEISFQGFFGNGFIWVSLLSRKTVQYFLLREVLCSLVLNQL